MTAFAQNTRDEVRVQGDGTISGALAAQPGAKQQTYVAECLTPWDGQAQRVYSQDGIFPTLQARQGKAGENSQAVLVNDHPVVMSSGQANAEIEMGGGCPDADRPARGACTSNGEDVFPALCATDGDKQFIDNQSVRSGRLILDDAEL